MSDNREALRFRAMQCGFGRGLCALVNTIGCDVVQFEETMNPHEPGTRLTDGDASRRGRMELLALLIVTALVMPALAVATVGTWGLTVWIYQAINGPPGPPSK
jgi:nitrate reductase NapE